MDNVGPIPRHIFDANEFIAHSAAIEDALDGIKSRDGERHFTHGGVRLWDTENPPQRVVRVVRGRGEVGAEGFLNAPISVCLGRRIPQYLGKRDECEGYFFLLLLLGKRNTLLSECVEGLACACLCLGGVCRCIIRGTQGAEDTSTPWRTALGVEGKP
ncbi:putative retrotransposon hot spot protein (RHS) [Trypanosoma cruzi]|uniref:Putative retrotransposon hot spot protein (RHS) n=1 Tax=Trypanosoma cruzi TaxID=5693 RepID=A0A2V2UND1_TRYCR|nr:putative retrotransposon hot spot protein (RHS) [Trypanosoma cruzi]